MLHKDRRRIDFSVALQDHKIECKFYDCLKMCFFVDKNILHV